MKRRRSCWSSMPRPARAFETVLGPDANEAHKNHFHLDMKKRRYVKICE